MIRSLYSGVSGMTNHQTRMDVIGNNIANVNTYGFKSSSAIFKDVYYQMTNTATRGTVNTAGNNPGSVGYGVQLAGIVKNMSTSNFLSTNQVLDIAIGGDGFFVTATFPGRANTANAADFSPTDISYTRMGALTIDSYGNLTDLNNRFILGTSNSAEGLRATGTDSSDILDDIDPPARARDLTFENRININELIQEAYNVFSDQYTGILYARDVNPDGTYAATYHLVDEYGNTLMSSATPPAPIPYTPLVPTGTPPVPPTQAAIDTARNAAIALGGKVGELTAKDLTAFEIGGNGVIQVTLNGEMKAIARIELAIFDNMYGLQEAGNTSFSETAASGEASFARAGTRGTGKIAAGFLEMSNVNLAKEFSDMIVTQRGFQANSRMITVSDSMLEELVNLKR